MTDLSKRIRYTSPIGLTHDTRDYWAMKVEELEEEVKLLRSDTFKDLRPEVVTVLKDLIGNMAQYQPNPAIHRDYPSQHHLDIARNSAHRVYLNWNQYSESDKLLRLGGLLWSTCSVCDM